MTLKTTEEQREAILRASDRDIIRGSHQLAFILHSDLKDLCHDADRARELEAYVETLEDKVTGLEQDVIDLRTKLDEAQKKYQELLYQVETKCPGEARHETALRYLRQAELHRAGTSQCDLKEQEKG